MSTPDKEARDRAHMRDLQVGLPARRAAVELLDAVLQKKQALDDILGRSLEKGAMFNLPTRDRALTRAIVAASLAPAGVALAFLPVVGYVIWCVGARAAAGLSIRAIGFTELGLTVALLGLSLASAG